jgi:hypothetical protein
MHPALRTHPQALQQMETQTPLPLLFMRTVISALKAAPKLKPFISDLISRLIAKQVRACLYERMSVGVGLCV